jgi:hypothetical protein
VEDPLTAHPQQLYFAAGKALPGKQAEKRIKFGLQESFAREASETTAAPGTEAMFNRKRDRCAGQKGTSEVEWEARVQAARAIVSQTAEPYYSATSGARDARFSRCE